MEKSKVEYLQPGDKVRLNKDIENAPKNMLVIRKEISFVGSSSNKKPVLLGIRCRFFDNNGMPHEEVFDTKDLEKV